MYSRTGKVSIFNLLFYIIIILMLALISKVAAAEEETKAIKKKKVEGSLVYIRKNKATPYAGWLGDTTFLSKLTKLLGDKELEITNLANRIKANSLTEQYLKDISNKDKSICLKNTQIKQVELKQKDLLLEVLQIELKEEKKNVKLLQHEKLLTIVIAGIITSLAITTTTIMIIKGE